MIWIIGNQGMLGRYVEEEFIKNNILTYGSDIDVDITKIKSLKNFVKDKHIEWIINCSGYTNVDQAENEKEKAMKINYYGIKNIVKICQLNDIQLIHISTDYVFDGKNTFFYSEKDKTNPINFYGKSKLKGEKYIEKNLQKYIILRTSWLYGKHGKNFVNTMIELFNKNDTINVVNDQFGSPTYAKDLAKTIYKIIKKQVYIKGIYHYSGEGQITWYQFCKAIYNIVKKNNIIQKEIQIKPIPSKEFKTLANRPKNSYLSKEKIRYYFKINIPEWEESLKKYILTEIKK